jgi:uncharacterized protein YPO0396
MPEFRTEIDIEPYEYVNECSKSEIKELINELRDHGYLNEDRIEPKNKTLDDIEFEKALMKIESHRQHLSLEEEAFIVNLSKRF